MSSAVDDLVTKYMDVLHIAGPRPVVVIRSHLGGRWLGRDQWSSRMPETTTMQIQRSILPHPLTLERVVAHEMVHHRNFLAMPREALDFAKYGIKPPAHGRDFLEGAAEVNALMGPGFVTIESDKEYVQAPLTRDLYVLIMPVSRGRLGWAWAARLSPEAEEIVRKKTAEGARLVRTNDRTWTAGRAKIRRYGGASVPKPGTPQEAALRELYERAG